MTRYLLLLVLPVGVAGLCTACMDTRTASLGIEAQRGVNIAPDAGLAPTRRDAGTGMPDTGAPRQRGDGADDRDDDDMHDDADRQDEEHTDAAVDAALEADGDAAVVDKGDASAAPVAIDAGPLLPASGDARVVEASVPHSDERDAAREDAKAPINPLCISEPWHCQ